MLPTSIKITLIWGIGKQIEMLEKNIKYLNSSDFPEDLKPSPTEITIQLIDIEKSLCYLEDDLEIKVDSLRIKFEEIKKTSSGRLISLLA